MEIRAHHRHARMSARKLRSMRGIVRGLSAAEARAQLNFLAGKAPHIVLQVLQSAIANAKHNFAADEHNLKVADLIVNEGLTMKRSQPRSRGMAHPILKRTAHVTVVLEETVGTKRQARAAAKKTDIQDISAAEFVDQHAPAAAPDTPVTKTSVKSTAAEAVPPSKEQEAHQIKKMQQQGGDKTKTHRRKSM